ncbi:MAG: septal ring lytic transglycosylase RlpA family protein [Ferruginibacter sp.]
MHVLKPSVFIIGISLVLFSSCGKYITETGEASYYGKGDKYNGRKTADGERFNTNDYTAAHKTIAFNTVVTVKNLSNGKIVKVRINDRGPYAKGRIIDLSAAAAKQIDMLHAGVAKVQIKYKRKKHS